MENFTVEQHTAMFISGIYAIDKLYDEYAKCVGLTYIGLMVLNAIHEVDGVFTQKQIAERTGLPKQSVNVVVRSLWEQGFLEMKELPRDRRNKEIWLSESGKEYTQRIIGALANTVETALARLTYMQRQDVINAIDQVTLSFKSMVQQSTHSASEQEV